MENDKIKSARVQLGGFFRERRQEMGVTVEMLSEFIGITPNTIRGIETGRFAWDIDLHFKICQALAIKPYFSHDTSPGEEDYNTRLEDDPSRYFGFYKVENLPLWPDQMAIVKLTHPRLFIRFNYPDTLFSSYEDWKANHVELSWLDPDDKPLSDEDIEYHLTDCWNFLCLHEIAEDIFFDEDEDKNEI